MRVIVHPDRLELVIDVEALAAKLDVPRQAEAPASVTHRASTRLTRTGHTLKLIDVRGVSAAPTPDPTLTRLLAQAHQWWTELARGETDIAKLSRRENVSASWMTRVVRLAFLAPHITGAILDGRARADLEGRALLATDAISPDWQEQGAELLLG